jgi:hypothetical protein
MALDDGELQPELQPKPWLLKLGVRGSQRWCREDPAASA